MAGSSQELQTLINGLTRGDRKSLAKAITLVESRRTDQKEQARELIKSLPAPKSRSLRIAISGAPGVGKSTFIETLGLFLIDQGHQPAILTVDPTSHISGGSILGDRTRMEELSKKEEAFIRQSPSANFLGGVSRRTRETVFACESAGFNTVLVETVGIGQSEYMAAELTDIFILLVQPGSGDELQGVKKGVMEMADILVVTKADGNLEESARKSVRHLKNAAHILQHKDHGMERKVCLVSAIQKKGIEEFWETVQTIRTGMEESGFIERVRKEQKINWLQNVIDEMWLDLLHNDQHGGTLFDNARDDVRSSGRHVYDAAEKLIQERIREL